MWEIHKSRFRFLVGFADIGLIGVAYRAANRLRYQPLTASQPRVCPDSSFPIGRSQSQVTA
jgi:hypothetical protein